ncbi:chromate efflux transporter [Methyloceanibacter sp.]|uniref:chromate efflux transporter n=1 Tax=Methyloceanibacter sp. TaxID=1965321 RepID=UPI002C5C82D0|nr:chromate efflux transporter [Methyloceanibacter sp.]HML92844.1 chromate efflux transporter [Methyloceanibacter sp.]
MDTPTDTAKETAPGNTDRHAPPLRAALPVWAKIGVASFGGPAGQIALMHRELVEHRGWIGPERFLHALNFCMLLPGPEAMQLATYIGWRLNGTLGGLAAGLLFVLPGAAVILTLSIAYAWYGQTPAVEAAFAGIKAAVLVIVIDALLKVAKRALHGGPAWTIAAAAFIAIFFFAVPFPFIVALAALAGYLAARFAPDNGAPEDASVPAAEPVPIGQTLRTVCLWLAVWIVPLVVVSLLFPPVFADISVFFSTLAVVSFGGAYAVLAYMAQQAVETYGWLGAPEMLDGLGLAETTPGPLILVTQFVGFLGAYRHGGEPALAFGLLGALVTLWATFAPCFLWIFAGAPYVERIRTNPRLAGALRGVTAAVVGVILNLSLWFALHVVFTTVSATDYGPLRLWLPEPASFQTGAALFSVLAAVLIFGVRLGILPTLAICAGASLAVSALL